ncbi:Leucine carboxyl methyltransferase family [Rasamsonia emersonii CBS 393.64]|uniref:tRNA wybutosine-synthesizing protein 4 n=1 Tax=Rasamsonia emersonii (strain ATCC 16479 / CBS 393.64 / IMI 116815) TaxID=1408163 RepID=A0A0F4YVY5_RASE3|nr:Leucine carboxyl methyltransferase family [Rasamsonia emersonii CBS 393.64]KKA22250.1 Leucine carboxyl methyltransferase family [Rasamsonia emersonii CBS 393.64]
MHYIGIGCDLKNLKKLEEALKSEIGTSPSSILCIAEVSLTYMDVESADALISWIPTLGEGQSGIFFPDGPDHPFAVTMMKHFNKLQAPLHSIHKYPSLSAQEQRFIDAGWRQACARSLQDVWNDNSFLSSSQRLSLDKVEAFDEWEEFALFASHYFLLSASTTTKEGVHNGCSRQTLSSSDLQTTHRLPLRLLHAPSSGQRRYGAIIPDSSTSLGVHGGLGSKSRLLSTDVYTSSDSVKVPVRPLPPPKIPARMCHTVTALRDDDCLLVGGRTSPTAALSDCWIREGDVWTESHPLPSSRFRHCATRLHLSDKEDCVLVYGGKTEKGDVLNDWLLWHGRIGWQRLEVAGGSPPARFGACMESIDGCSGVLFGGMTQDGIVLDDFWTWTVSERGDGSKILELIDQSKNFQAATPLAKFVGRFGATANMTTYGLVIIGGIGMQGVVPADYEIMLLNTQELIRCRASDTPWTETILSAVGLGHEFSGPRPLLSGHVSCATSPSEVLVVGGGAVCFSFGTFWNDGTWQLQDATSDRNNRWAMLREPAAPDENTPKPTPQPSLQEPASMNEIKQIPRRAIRTPEEFQEVIAQSRPVVIPEADLGRCTELWTKDYLTRTVGFDRKVVVHEARSEHMNFQKKNFSYVTKDFGAFLDEVYAGSRQYLRSVSADQPSKLPANLAEDFPELKNDFHLPSQLAFAEENAHSSPLRISGPVTMWLHYDVMANVLCQIQGQKRLILYPPSDVQYLQLPAGASSSTIDIFENMTDGRIASIPHTSPHEAILKPGDILFIPPLWLHTTAPVGGVSIAVNVFFRNLSKGYAAGRDVYANRDLQAYEKGRNDVAKIARSFEGLPPDMARFYLLRLADELREKAYG